MLHTAVAAWFNSDGQFLVAAEYPDWMYPWVILRSLQFARQSHVRTILDNSNSRLVHTQRQRYDDECAMPTARIRVEHSSEKFVFIRRLRGTCQGRVYTEPHLVKSVHPSVHEDGREGCDQSQQ